MLNEGCRSDALADRMHLNHPCSPYAGPYSTILCNFDVETDCNKDNKIGGGHHHDALFVWPNCPDILLVELYGSIVDDLRVRWPGLCSLFQVASPGYKERLIELYTVSSNSVGDLIAEWIAIAVPGKLVDV